MDIRYHAGGNDPQTVIPNQQLTMMMEFQTADAILPAGHGLKIVFTDTGEDYLCMVCLHCSYPPFIFNRVFS